MLEPLPHDAPVASRADRYREVRVRLDALVEGVDDPIARMATIVCELHHAFEAFHWTGFYRVTRPGLLSVGPYQGGHGCLEIPFDRGVCGAAARTGRVQLVDDVTQRADHIACSSTTRSEVVVPVFDGTGAVVAVLDVDSDHPSAFDALDGKELQALLVRLTPSLGSPPPTTL